MLLMPGDDLVHPAPISEELARAPQIEVLAPWKGAQREAAMGRIRDFMIAHQRAGTPARSPQ
jgi:hypothetical protein